MTNFNTIVIHYGEIGLKGRNQSSFIEQLARNIELKLNVLQVTGNEKRVTNFKKLPVTGQKLPVVKWTRGYIVIDLPPSDSPLIKEGAMQVLKEVTGVVWYAAAERFKIKDLRLKIEEVIKELESKIVETANEIYESNKTFRVTARRADKSFEVSSHDMEVRLGKLIQDNSKWQAVDLDEPGQTFYVDVYPEEVFLYAEKLRGLGGMPVGSSGRVLSLLSGGIDSPVASFLLAKRGAQVDFVHFTATKLQHKEAEQYKVSRLAQKLSEYTLRSKLHLVPYTHFQLAVMEQKFQHELVIFRRFMARVAEQLAEQTGALALASGDSLAQVASQTLSNLVSTSQAVSLPVLRPLLGLDKVEIINLARELGTYEISLEPYKDCCSIISRHPKTSSVTERLEKIEAEIFSDYQKLAEDTLAEVVTLEYECGKLVS